MGSPGENILRFCPRCGSVISKAKEKTCGSMLSVMMRCMNNHNKSWISQPVPRNTAAAILFGENTFARRA